jgi:hypothetical protein
VCYDNSTLNPSIRTGELYLRRYGPRLRSAPETMCEDTHYFSEGKVWEHGDPKAPATAEQVALSTVEKLAATIDQMLASGAGKTRLMALHAEGVRIAAAAAIARGCFQGGACVTIVPPRGDRCWELDAAGESDSPRETQYGEADMLIVHYARAAVALGQRVCLCTIDTDALLQAALYVRPDAAATLDIHIANVYVGEDGTVGPKQPKYTRNREIVSIAACDALTPTRMALILVYGGDYVGGLCIRGIGLPKQALFELISSCPDECVTLDPVQIDFAALFACMARACRAPNTKPVDVAALNGEMQRLAYCLAYWAGARPDDGGPELDARQIVPLCATRASLLAGAGCPVYEYQ